jgi:hypothetical protein
MKHDIWLKLKSSKIQGVGVFTEFDISKGEEIKLWDGEDCKFVSCRKYSSSSRIKKNFINTFCVETNGGYWCPLNFERMSVGWYINHSDKPNTESFDWGDTFFAKRKIKEGEELTIDYALLDKDIDNSLYPPRDKH